MPRKICKAEEIIAELRQFEVLTSQGQSVVDALRSIGVWDATYRGARCAYRLQRSRPTISSPG